MPAALERVSQRAKSAGKGHQVSPQELDFWMQQAIVEQVQVFIRIKLLYLQAKAKVPEDKMPEMRKRMEKDFDDNMVPTLMKNMNCKSHRELEDRLRLTGNSLDRLKRVTVEELVAKSWFKQEAKTDDIKRRDDLSPLYKAPTS